MLALWAAKPCFAKMEAASNFADSMSFGGKGGSGAAALQSRWKGTEWNSD